MLGIVLLSQNQLRCLNIFFLWSVNKNGMRNLNVHASSETRTFASML